MSPLALTALCMGLMFAAWESGRRYQASKLIDETESLNNFHAMLVEREAALEASERTSTGGAGK